MFVWVFTFVGTWPESRVLIGRRKRKWSQIAWWLGYLKTKVVANSLVTRNRAFSLAEFRSHFSSQISNATFKMESRQDHTEFLTKSNTKEIWLNLKVKTLYLYFNLLNKDSTMFGESKYLKVLCFQAKKLTKNGFFLLKFCFSFVLIFVFKL